MKKLLTSVFFFLLMASLPWVAYAQETESQPTTSNSSEDQQHEPTLQELEPTPSKVMHSKQDSASARPLLKIKAIPEKSADKKTEEEAGPFNFLYYIIQRFKSSDIIEE
jgi:hypothetical protein